MRGRFRFRGGLHLLVFLACLVWFALPSAYVPLTGRDEGRFAEASRQMLEGGDWVVPRFAGRNRYDKPVLIYWLMAGSFKLLGTSELAARLPSTVAASATCTLVYHWAMELVPPQYALLAAAMTASTLTFSFQARAATADQVMLFPLLVSLYCVWRLRVGKGNPTVSKLGIWLGLGMSVLAKGPVAPLYLLAAALWEGFPKRSWIAWVLLAAGIVWLGPVVWLPLGLWIGLRLLALRKKQKVSSPSAGWGVAWGIPLALLIVLPWAVLAWVRTDGEFFRAAVGKHVVSRSLSAMESHGGVPGFYLLTAPVAMFPLFPLLIGALPGLLSTFAGATAMGSLMVLETVRTKLVHYWMPAYPLLAVRLAASLWRREASPGKTLRAIQLAVALFGGALLAAAPLVVLLRLKLFSLIPAAVPVSLVALGSAVSWLFAADGGSVRFFWLQALLGLAYSVSLIFLFLAPLGSYAVAPRTARAAVEVAGGDRIVVFKPKDDEVFFYLPPDVRVARSREALLREVSDTSRAVVVARCKDLAGLEAYLGGRVAAKVRGVELGRVRWVVNCIMERGEDAVKGGGSPRMGE